jgi:hypothetical protein
MKTSTVLLSLFLTIPVVGCGLLSPDPSKVSLPLHLYAANVRFDTVLESGQILDYNHVPAYVTERTEEAALTALKQLCDDVAQKTAATVSNGEVQCGGVSSFQQVPDEIIINLGIYYKEKGFRLDGN